MSLALDSQAWADGVGEAASTWDNSSDSRYTGTWRSAYAHLHNKKYVSRTGARVLPTIPRPAIDFNVRRQLFNEFLDDQMAAADGSDLEDPDGDESEVAFQNPSSSDDEAEGDTASKLSAPSTTASEVVRRDLRRLGRLERHVDRLKAKIELQSDVLRQLRQELQAAKDHEWAMVDTFAEILRQHRAAALQSTRWTPSPAAAGVTPKAARPEGDVAAADLLTPGTQPRRVPEPATASTKRAKTGGAGWKKAKRREAALRGRANADLPGVPATPPPSETLKLRDPGNTSERMSYTERVFIYCLAKCGWHPAHISACVGRSVNGVKLRMQKDNLEEFAAKAPELQALVEKGAAHTQLECDIKCSITALRGEATVTRILERLRRMGHPPMSQQALRRQLASMGMKWRRKTRSCLMTAQHRQDRIDFAKAMLEKADAGFDLSRIVFTDEKMFYPGGSSTHTWGDGPVQRRQCRREGQMAFLAINEHHHFSIFWYPPKKSIDADVYLDTVKEYFTEEALRRGTPQELIVQEDNAAVHFAQRIVDAKKDVFKGLCDELGEKWPAKSPDLSPIENLWAWLDHKLKQSQVDTQASMRRIVDRALNTRKGRDVVKSLCRSFRARLEKVKLHNGDNIQNTKPLRAAALPGGFTP